MRRGHGPGHGAQKRATATGAARDSGFYESADKAGLSIIYNTGDCALAFRDYVFKGIRKVKKEALDHSKT